MKYHIVQPEEGWVLKKMRGDILGTIGPPHLLNKKENK